MASTITALNSRRRFRRNFGSISEVAAMPNLIDVQRTSYELFLQRDIDPEKREDSGLQEVFRSVFPIKDFNDKAVLEFVSYTLEKPKYDVEECQQRGLNFASPLKVTLRLVVWEEDDVTGMRSLRDTKEQEVYMGDMPLMTKNGTFVINGTERVIVSQMHRSPGVFFDNDRGKSHASGKLLFSARVIPYRGSWLDFEFDPKDIVHVRIDRKRKLPATTFLMALLDETSEAYLAECEKEGIEPERTKVNGLSREAILNYFYEAVAYKRDKKGWRTGFDASMRGARLNHDLVNADTGKVAAKKGDKLTPRSLRKLKEDGIKEVLVSNEELMGQYLAHDIVDKKTGLVLAEAGDILGEETLAILDETKPTICGVLAIDHVNVGAFLRNTLAADRNHSREDALTDNLPRVASGRAANIRICRSIIFGIVL